MKTTPMLLAMLGLASSLALAQTATEPAGSDQPQAPSGESGYQSPSEMQGDMRSGDQDKDQSGAASEESQGNAPSSGASDTGYQPENRPPPAPMTVVEPKTANGFTYMCGGVGEEETAKMKQAARAYDMMLTFATRRGAYLADVNVNIQDARGESALQTTCDAPIMLINVPKSGTYRIRAEAGGYTLNKTAHVKTKGTAHAALVMTWPQQVAETAEPATTSTGSSGNQNNSGDTSAGGAR